jgi:hypothetical protein
MFRVTQHTLARILTQDRDDHMNICCDLVDSANCVFHTIATEVTINHLEIAIIIKKDITATGKCEVVPVLN